MKITLSYTICSASPWSWKYNSVGEFTLREPKTEEELRQEKLEREKLEDDEKRPIKRFKFSKHSVFEIRGNTCYFLIGAWHKLKEELDKQGEEYEVEDKRDPKLKPEPNYDCLQNVEFRSGQVEAIAAIVTADCGLLCSSVGYGKSFVIRQLCKMYSTLNILVVCMSGEVVKELYRDIAKELPGEVGLLNMDNNDVNGKRIIVTTAKSMVKIKPEQVQLLLVDECHNFGYNESGFELEKFCFCRRFGFTATPVRNNGDLKYFESLFGPVLQQYSFEDSVQAGSVTPIKYAMLPSTKKLDYLNDLSKDLPAAIVNRLYYTNNPVRNSQIVKCFRDLKASAPDKQIIIMVQAIEHLIRLCEQLPECYFAHGERGSLDKYKKKKGLTDVNMTKYRQSTKQLNWVKKCAETGEYQYIICTGVWKQGINLSHLAILIRADGAVSNIPSVQIPGRLARLDENKPVAYLIDFADDFTEASERRAKEREKHYVKEGWEKSSFIDILNEIKT